MLTIFFIYFVFNLFILLFNCDVFENALLTYKGSVEDE